MKKYFFITGLALSFLLNGFCQLADSIQTKQPASKTLLLEKSKTQKTAGYILLGSGVIIGSIGFIRAMTELGGILDPEGTYHDDNISAILGYGGLVLTAGSVPLILAGRKNKRKAMNLSFKQERIFQLSNKGFVQARLPAIQLSLKF